MTIKKEICFTLHSALLAAVLLAHSAFAQTAAPARPPRSPIFISPELASSVALITPPPALNSKKMAKDVAEIYAIHRSASPQEIERANFDNKHEDIFAIFSVFGDKFNRESMPAIAALWADMNNDQGIVVSAAKRYFAHPRPYDLDSNIKSICGSKAGGPKNSYPSGHGTVGYLSAMVLSMMVPEKSEAIHARAEEYGHNRVVCGDHYAADIPASKEAAVLIMGGMIGNARFQQEFSAAKAEVRHSLGLPVVQAASGYRVTDRFPIGGSGGWDYISIDSAARRLYLSHATQVNVLDADTGKPLGVIPDTPGVHGIAIATGMDRGFTSNGKEDKVSIFNTKTLELIEKVSVGKGPDGIFYDANSKRVFTNNHGSKDITAIDAARGKVVGTVEINGAGEQMVNGRNGLLFVNLEDTHQVVAFDPVSLAVKSRFPLGEAKTPTGLAFDQKNNRLFVGCRSKSLVVMDAADGTIVASLPIGGNVDYAGFDPEAGLIFTSNGEGSLSVIRQVSSDKYEDAGAVTTQQSAKTMAFDQKTKKIFLPAAEFDTVPASGPGGKVTRKMKEGSFVVLVVSK